MLAAVRLRLDPLGKTSDITLAEHFFIAHVNVAVLSILNIRRRYLAHHLALEGQVLVADGLISTGTDFGLRVGPAGRLRDIALVAFTLVTRGGRVFALDSDCACFGPRRLGPIIYLSFVSLLSEIAIRLGINSIHGTLLKGGHSRISFLVFRLSIGLLHVGRFVSDSLLRRQSDARLVSLFYLHQRFLVVVADIGNSKLASSIFLGRLFDEILNTTRLGWKFVLFKHFLRPLILLNFGLRTFTHIFGFSALLFIQEVLVD